MIISITNNEVSRVSEAAHVAGPAVPGGRASAHMRQWDSQRDSGSERARRTRLVRVLERGDGES